MRSARLNDAFHQVRLIIHRLAADAAPHHVHEGVDILETQVSEVLKETAGDLLLDVTAIAGLGRERPTRCVNELGILFEGRGDLRTTGRAARFIRLQFGPLLGLLFLAERA